MKSLRYLLVIPIFFLVTACPPILDNPELKPEVLTSEVTLITSISAHSGGYITDDGGAPISARGVCWSKNHNPTIADSKSSDGSGTGEFTSSITNLSPNTSYYVKAYATNVVGTAYGEEVSFTTIDVPTVNSVEILQITANSAQCRVTIVNDGGAQITARGVCWSINQNPTIADNRINEGAGTGVFTCNLGGLLPGTKYYVRAYATNSEGTVYSDQISFTTYNIPSVTTTQTSAVTSSSAQSGGNVTNDGGTSVTARGVCWSTSQNPTTANSVTVNGSGIGVFTSTLTNLSSNTNYWYCAYAVNAAGTGYGQIFSFKTASDPITVVTSAVSDRGVTTATCGGNVISDGGVPVTSRGVCWSTNQNPTLANSKTTNGSGSGLYISYLTGLSANTTYFVRAYATNSNGTSYGDVISFTTLVKNFNNINRSDIANVVLSSNQINGSNNANNQIPTNTIVVYKTNLGRYGKFLVKTYSNNLVINWVTFNSNGTVYSSGSNLTIRGTYLADLDEGLETSSGADFWWEIIDSIERYIVPRNGALFYVYH